MKKCGVPDLEQQKKNFQKQCKLVADEYEYVI